MAAWLHGCGGRRREGERGRDGVCELGERVKKGEGGGKGHICRLHDELLFTVTRTCIDHTK
jgi:hypothetical protein